MTSTRERLDALVGEWEMDAHWLVRGRAKFGWIEDGAFMLQRARAELPKDAEPGLTENFPFPITTIIGVDDFSETFGYVYTDARGVSRVGHMTLEGREWTISDRAGAEFFQRFTGTFSEDGNEISGRWERSPDGQEWELDFEITYSKVS
jgi:hypothetical protein